MRTLPTPLTLALSLVLATAPGCMGLRIADRYRAPIREYPTRVANVAAVESGRDFPALTAGQTDALVATRVGLYDPGQGFDAEYRSLNDTTLFAKLLESTRCVARVDTLRSMERTTWSPLSLEIESSAKTYPGIGGWIAVVLEAYTLTGYLGLPYPEYAEGKAKIDVSGKGAPGKPLIATARLHYTTNMYRSRFDMPLAESLARAMALRDASDQLAALLCGDSAPAP